MQKFKRSRVRETQRWEEQVAELKIRVSLRFEQIWKRWRTANAKALSLKHALPIWKTARGKMEWTRENNSRWSQRSNKTDDIGCCLATTEWSKASIQHLGRKWIWPDIHKGLFGLLSWARLVGSKVTQSRGSDEEFSTEIYVRRWMVRSRRWLGD